MRRAIAALCVAAISACAAPVAETPEPGVLQPAPPPADASAVPAGSDIMVRLTDDLNADSVRIGRTFTAEVSEPLIAMNRDTVIPAGSVITGMVTGVDRSTGDGDQAAIRVNFLRIDIAGTTHPFAADIVSTRLPGTPDVDATAVVAGAAAGAVLGAVIGGDLRDALIGAALGAGAGTIISLGTGDVDEVLPAGTLLTVRTRDTIDLGR